MSGSVTGELLAEWRRFRGLTMVQLRDRTMPQVDHGAISRYEKGVSSPGEDVLYRLIKGLFGSQNHCRRGNLGNDVIYHFINSQ